MLAELLATRGVDEVFAPGGPVGIMAIHGGLEEGTDTIAAELAQITACALYAVVQPRDLWWHVPSIRYDPAHSTALSRFLGGVDVVVSLHGYGEPGLEGVALLGGSNRGLAATIGDALAERGISAISDLECIPSRLRGVHRLNPVNLPSNGGVQIELPMGLREGAARHQVVEALAEVIVKQLVAAGN